MDRAGMAQLAALLGLALGLAACMTTTTVDGVQVPNKNNGIVGASAGDAGKRAEVRLRLAASYYQSGQLQIAMETARRAIDLDPNLAAAHGLLGLMLMDVGQVTEADASFRRALALDRDNPDLNNNYAWFLCQTGRERDSIAYFDRALAQRLYDSPVRALQNAGICLLRIRDDANAEKYLLRAFAADATSPIVKFYLAQMYLRQRRLDRCDFYFDLLVRSAEANADTLWLGARLAHAKGDDATERRYAEQLQARFPDSAPADALHHGRFDE